MIKNYTSNYSPDSDISDWGDWAPGNGLWRTYPAVANLWANIDDAVGSQDGHTSSSQFAVTSGVLPNPNAFGCLVGITTDIPSGAFDIEVKVSMYVHSFDNAMPCNVLVELGGASHSIGDVSINIRSYNHYYMSKTATVNPRTTSAWTATEMPTGIGVNVPAGYWGICITQMYCTITYSLRKRVGNPIIDQIAHQHCERMTK